MLMRQDRLLEKIKKIPVAYQQQVEDFIDFILEKKYQPSLENGRKFGLLKGKLKMSDDFDEPIEDFKEYM